MYLKEVQMENFKTFRKKVSIPFYKGFTGVTGPNGSGKSNVADAILFVLGPRSSKLVRARKLSDLIFHGNDNFKASKECKVSLLFDNTDRIIPVDSDEVSLKRVLRISTTDPNNTLSYFYVNGKASSQGEFENILAHAHLSAEGYNIVQQGQINDFINKTPQKVREEIDEIAGIRRYDEEIRVSLQKKEQTLQNMERINWHLDFIRGRLRDLRKEKEEAEKYREAQLQINQSKGLLYTVQREAVEGELQSYREAIDACEKRKIELRGEMDKLESERSRLEGEMKKLESEIADITGEEGKKLKSKLDESKLEMMRARDVMETAETAESELDGEKKLRDQELKDIRRKKASLEKEIALKESELRKLEGREASIRKEMKALEGELERSDTDHLEMRRSVGLVSKELESTRDQLAEKVLEKDRASAALETLKASIVDLDQMVSTLEYEVKDLGAKTKEMAKKEAEAQAKKLQKDFMAGRAKEKELGARMRDLEREITSLNRLYTQMKLEMEASEKLSKGMSMAVDDMLTARDTGEIKGIYGTIGELGNVPDDYSTALEVAAGGRIFAVIVEDDEVAAQCIERLKRKKIGRVTFLPLNKVAQKKPGPKALMVKDDPHVVGLAVDLVKFDERYRAAFSWAFGDTVVVDDLSTLRRLMGGVRIVTLQGELAGSGGDITGGSLSGKKEGPGFGKRSKSELESISDQLKERMAESESVTAELNKVREEVNTLEAEIRKLTSDQADMEGRRKKADETLQTAKAQLEEKAKERDAAKQQRSKLEKEQKGLEDAVKELEGKVSTLIGKRDSMQDSLEKVTPKSMRDRMKDTRTEIDTIMLKKTELTTARDNAKAQIELFDQRASELQKRLSEIAEAKEKARKEGASAKEREDRYQKEVRALETVLSNIDVKTKGLYERLNATGREQERVLAQRDKARSDLLVQDQIVITQRTNIRAAEEKLADVLRELQSFKGVELPPKPYPPEKDLAKKVRDLESILENVGNVNLKALEEYEENERKKTEIDQELKALEKEKEELDKLIDSINQKRKGEFMHVYEAVDHNFRDIYSLISSGGEAYFELENPEDPLSAGLMIHAKPPGKKMTRLQSLSGGEKSLTSMAFIFAVQAFDPSPFYLLDEVDQNLDAVNAEIVAKMVAKNASFAQFVMISLRKISLKEAHHLYGVTLQKGESVIVGRVDLKEVEVYEKGDGTARNEAAPREAGA